MGLTSATETAEVAAWAKQYREVAAEIETIQSGLENYAQMHVVEPGASVKEKVLAAIHTNKTAPVIDLKAGDKAAAAVHQMNSFWKYAVAASILLLAASIFFNYSFYTRYRATNTELASVKTELLQQKDLAADMHDAMGVMGNKNAMPVSLAGTPEEPDAAARIYWMQNTKEVYIDPSNLPKTPAGKQYQFWAIVDGKPVNGGIITTQINGKIVHVQKMKSFGKAQAFAVSLEDAGPEKPEPTKVIVVGSM